MWEKVKILLIKKGAKETSASQSHAQNAEFQFSESKNIDAAECSISENNDFDIEEYNRINHEMIERVKEQYDMDSLEGIRAIPVPNAKPSFRESTPSIVVLIEYILQRKATEHKKNNHLDLAIECLRKSNEIMPYSSVRYTEDDYMRLVEYLKLARRFDEAREEQQRIERAHPEFALDTGNPHLTESLNRAKELGCDYVSPFTSSCCPKCSMYFGRIYCISGRDPRFAPLSQLPEFMTKNRCFMCECYISYSLRHFTLESEEEIQKASKYSLSAPTDTRTDEQKKFFLEKSIERAEKRTDKIAYDWLWEYIPELCPKSFSGYCRMKHTRSKNYQKIYDVAKEKGFDLETGYLHNKEADSDEENFHFK